MVTTLIKHDFIRTRSLLFAAAGIVFAMAVVLSLSTHLLSTGRAGSAPGLAMSTFVFGIVLTFGFLPLVQLWLGVDLYRSSFSRRGYLVQTLPMKGSAILAAKYLWALLVTAFALVVSLLVGLLTAVGGAKLIGVPVEQLWDLVVELIRTVNLSAGAWAIVILFGVVYLLQSLIQYYFCVTVGSEAWINKLGVAGPILVWFGVYVVMQVVGLVSLVLPGVLIISNGGIEFSWQSFFGPILNASYSDSAEGVPVLPVATIGVMLIAFALMAWRSFVSAARKVDLR